MAPEFPDPPGSPDSQPRPSGVPRRQRRPGPPPVSVGALAVLLLASPAADAVGQDWPQWRGLRRTGAAAGFTAPATLPETLTRRYAVPVGLGYATPLIVGDRIFQYARQEGEEVMWALEAETGETGWRTAWPAPFEMHPAARSHGPGPKSTPAFADGRLFAHGMDGAVTALDAATGERLWRFPGTGNTPLYHTAMSPLVLGDRVVVHVGGHDEGALTAFDAATGEPHWRWEGDGPAYGSPMAFDLGGVRQVVVFTQDHFLGVDAETGALLWQRPFTTSSDTTSQTPLLHGDRVIQAGRGNGVTAFRVVREGGGWTTEDDWRVEEVSLHMANPVASGGVLFGLSHRNSGQYFALDLDSGVVLWTSAPRQARHASLTLADGLLFSLEDDGELLVLEAGGSDFRVLRRYPVADTETWAAPSLSGDRLFIKDENHLTLWTME